MYTINEQTEYKRKVRLMSMLLVFFLAAYVAIWNTEESEAASIYGGTVNKQYLQFDYTASNSGNTTTISWALYCVPAGNNYTYKNQAPTSVYVNGGLVWSGNTAYDVRSGTKLLCSGTAYVGRTNGGAANIPVSASIDMSGTSVGSIGLSGSIALGGYTVSSSHKVTGNVVWDDDNNRDGKRPQDVTVTLYRNGTAFKTETLAYPDTEYSFTGLITAQNGTAYKYTVGGSAADGYEPTPDGNNVVYIHEPETTTITDRIVWDDDNNRDGKRPDIVIVKFYKNGEEVSEKQMSVTALTDYEYSFEDLYVYENEGQRIDYDYEVIVPDGYGMDENGNLTYTPERTGFDGIVNVVQGVDSPSSVDITILKNGSIYETVTLPDASGKWEYSFENLFVYEDGEKINYTILPSLEPKYRSVLDQDGNIIYKYYKGKGYRLGFAI